jgi:hypothetical protein
MTMKYRQTAAPITVFYSYAHEDEPLREQLETHLSLMRKQGIIAEWHDRKIVPGSDWSQEIDAHLNSASIILLFISSDFLASDYCYNIEMQRALERHELGEARVIPVILRPVDWHSAPFGYLQCLPRDGKAVTEWDNRDAAFRDIAQGIRRAAEQLSSSASTKPPLSALERQNRTYMLKRVRSFWIEGVLERSLYHEVLLELGLQEQPDMLVNPWRPLMQESTPLPRSLPTGTSITQVYDQSDGQLLILGEPGAGKTTLLLALTRTLLDRAEQEKLPRMPVVFNLASWSQAHQPLALWLTKELMEKYEVPREVAHSWVRGGHVLPLLDALDEVQPVARSACIEAINTYHHEHPTLPLVVCGRMAEYQEQPVRLRLRQAVLVQPLTEKQLTDYFQHFPGLEALHQALHEQPLLQKVVTTPLVLTVLTLASQDHPPEEDMPVGSAERQQQRIFATYVQRMLERGAEEKRYTKEQTVHWLTYLARQMKRHNQAIFYIEHMQPDWLDNKRLHQRCLGMATGLLFGLIGAIGPGPAGGLLLRGLFFESSGGGSSLSLLFGLTLLFGLVSGSLFGLFNGLLFKVNTGNRSTATRRWSWGQIRHRMIRGVLNGTLVGLLLGVPYGLYLGQQQGNEPSWIVMTGVICGLLGALGFGLIDRVLSFSPTEIKPAEVFVWSWARMGQNLVKLLGLGLLGSLLVGLLIGLFYGLYEWITDQTANMLNVVSDILLGERQFALLAVPLFMLIGGLLAGLTGGLSGRALEEHRITTPNQGIRYSVRQGIILGTVGGLTGGIVGATLGGVVSGVHDLNELLSLMGSYGLIIGSLVGLTSGLRGGGMACIQHIVLRWSLWKAGSLPWNCARFLDYTTAHILLRKVGGGYIFIHRLLLEYFALSETAA